MTEHSARSRWMVKDGRLRMDCHGSAPAARPAVWDGRRRHRVASVRGSALSCPPFIAGSEFGHRLLSGCFVPPCTGNVTTLLGNCLLERFCYPLHIPRCDENLLFVLQRKTQVCFCRLVARSYSQLLSPTSLLAVSFAEQQARFLRSGPCLVALFAKLHA